MDILERITAYDCSDGGHCDAAQGSAYDLLSDAKDEVKALRAQALRDADSVKRLIEYATRLETALHSIQKLAGRAGPPDAIEALNDIENFAKMTIRSQPHPQPISAAS